MVGCLIQARMGSSRLPEKVLEKIEGFTMLEHIIRRLQRTQKVERFILATTTLDQDQILVNKAHQLGIDAFCGSQDNVLQRFIEAAEIFGVTTIVRICADSPFVDPQSIDKMVDFFHKNSASVLTINPDESRLLDGIEITDLKSLQYFAQHGSWNPDYLEHVTLFPKREESQHVKYFPVPKQFQRTDLKINVDTPEDLVIVREIAAKVITMSQDPFFDLSTLVRAFPS